MRRQWVPAVPSAPKPETIPKMLDITAFYAGLMALWIIALATLVGAARTKHKISVGDGGVPELLYRMRAHGNAVETIPIALILLALTETLGAPSWVVHGLGLLLVAGRLAHGLYFLQGAQQMALRGIGMLLTMGMILLAAVGLAGHGLMDMIAGGGA